MKTPIAKECHPATMDHSIGTLLRLADTARSLSHDHNQSFDDLQDIANILEDLASVKGGWTLRLLDGTVIDLLSTQDEHEHTANEEARHGNRDALETMTRERDRLRELIREIKRDADEWCVSRMTGNPELENRKGEAMWQTIRKASSMTAPIETALEDKQ